MIILDDVSKSFGQTCAVSHLSVTIEDSEIFGLVGPNGAGKTTTIRMMTGLLAPDYGRILIGKHDIVLDPIGAKSIVGYVPDRAFLYDKLTAREFLVFVSSIYGVSKEKAMSSIDNLLETFGISDVGDELIESFSQGMRQRLLFSAALVHKPAVLMIDEPFMGLDPFGVKMLKGIIRDLGTQGVSIFLATHSLHIAEELCHRVGFINDGGLSAIKSREDIRHFDGGLEALFMQISS